MYMDFYRLNCQPFENTPDPRFFFASEQHREALAAIEYVIRMRKGYVLVTGEIGSGKTTVGRTMLERCGNSAKIVGVLHGHDSPEELLRQILQALGARCAVGEHRSVLVRRLQARLQTYAADQQPVVLYVDEAQTLTDRALEELRLLSNFDTNTLKLIQVVLIGQPELRQRIAGPRFAALRQRIVMAKSLRPLTLPDTGAYIVHRLRSAGWNESDPSVTFAREAIEEIYTYSRGTPRVINFACDNCLLLGFVQEARQITAAMAQRVIADMVPSFDVDVVPPETREPNLSLAGSY